MIDFVDLHCHALFRVDDGARDESDMEQMLDLAYSDGTRHLCFTPHFKIYEFDNEEQMERHIDRLNRRFAVAQSYASQKYPDMTLYLGNEIMYHSDIADSVFSKRCLTLGGSSYVLVEFSPDTTAYEIENTIIKLLRKGVRPIIAHIERYSAIVKNPSVAKSLRDSGALLQVNAKGIARFKFGRIARLLRFAFKKKIVDVVASDSHNCTSFPPLLSKAYAYVSKNYGSEYADKIFHRTPMAVLENEKIL